MQTENKLNSETEKIMKNLTELTALALAALLTGCQAISADTAYRVEQWAEVKDMQYRDIVAKENFREALDRQRS